MQDRLDRVLEALAAHGCPVGPNGACRCPNHKDSNPSMVVSLGDERILMHCHAGCPTPEIVERIGLTMADLFPEKKKGLGRIEETYLYRDANDQPSYEVVRFEGKQFRQRRPGAEEWGLKGATPLLYRLPELLDEISLGSTIYVCEGEADVLAMEHAGAVATCNSGGAGKWRPEFGEILSNAEHVIIVADRDAPGYAHADAIVASLNGASYEIVEAAEGKDARDHLAAGHGLADFVAARRVSGSPSTSPAGAHSTDSTTTSAVPGPGLGLPVAPGEPEPTPMVVRVRDGTAFRMQPVVWLPGYEGFIPIGMLSMLAGLPGLGKSMFGTYLACALSKYERVMIAAAEDSIEHTLLPRLVAGGAVLRNVLFVDIEGASIRLPDHEHLLRAAVEEWQPKLLILDPIGSFMGRSIDVWKDTDVRGALDPLKLLAEENAMALLMLAHLNKGTGPYLTRLANSAAFGQVVRSGMLWARDPDDPEKEDGDRRILVSGKLNVAQRPLGHIYRIAVTSVQDDEGRSYGTAQLQFVEKVSRQTDDLLLQRQPEKPPTISEQEAMEHLRAFLADGSRSRVDVLAAAKDWDLSRATVDRAFDCMRGVSRMEGFPAKAMWSLP